MTKETETKVGLMPWTDVKPLNPDEWPEDTKDKEKYKMTAENIIMPLETIDEILNDKFLEIMDSDTDVGYDEAKIISELLYARNILMKDKFGEDYKEGVPFVVSEACKPATCSKCGKEKPAEDFYRDSRKKNRKTSQCKACYYYDKKSTD